MKLIVFAGKGDPAPELYSRVYALFRRQALERGFDSVDTSLRWLGHFSRATERAPASLALPAAVTVARKRIR
jgi:hypothetical protein